MKQLVLVVGAAGQLGEAMAAGLSARNAVVARTRRELDVTSGAAVREAVATICPDVIVNCAAWTDVDGAESHPVEALEVNAWAVRTLARAALDHDATFVHFSTDFVFDGKTTSPYTEDDTPNPRGTYAASKLIGEWFASEVPRHYVLRVESLFGGARARSSIDRLLDGIRAGTPIKAIHDRVVSPSYVDDVVTATDGLLRSGAASGLYHCVNSGWATWLEVARELAVVAGCPSAAIEAVSQSDLQLPTPRPLFAALSNARLESVGVPMPSWQDAVRRHVTAWAIGNQG